MKSPNATLNNVLLLAADSEILQRLKSEYESKPTVKYGAWVMTAMLVLYLSLVISDEAEIIETNLEQANSRLARIEQVQSEQFWFERLATEESNIESIKSAIRNAKTKSLAKAQMQASFTDFAKEALQQPRVSVSEPVYAGDYYGQKLYTVNTELRGKVKKGAALNVLSELAKTPHVQEVEMFDVEFQQNRQFRIIVKSYFFIPE